MTTQHSRIIQKHTPVTQMVSGDMMGQGELLFCKDTGRLFIGAGTEPDALSYDRATVPGRNIEIITEASLETVKRILREMGVSVPDVMPVMGQISDTILLFNQTTDGEIEINGQPIVMAAGWSASYTGDFTGSLSSDGVTITHTMEPGSQIDFSQDAATNHLLYSNTSTMDITITLTPAE